MYVCIYIYIYIKIQNKKQTLFNASTTIFFKKLSYVKMYIYLYICIYIRSLIKMLYYYLFAINNLNGVTKPTDRYFANPSDKENLLLKYEP